MTEARWNKAKIREFAELIKDIDICMFVTRSNGSLHGRPMSNNGKVEYDGDSWFFSFRDSAKIREIEVDPRVELAYVATEQGTWVSIEGRGEIVEDDERKKELWDEDLEQWFQDGPEDDKVVLVKVTADRIHAWANGEEVIAEPPDKVERIESDEEPASAR